MMGVVSAPAPEHPAGPERPVAPPSTPPLPLAPPPIPPPSYPNYGYYPVVKPPGNTPAILALVLGCAGLFFFLTSFGLVFFVNLPCSIAAWILGVHGKRRVDRGETLEHRGLAQAGMVLGIVGVVIGTIAIVVWVLIFVLAGSTND